MVNSFGQFTGDVRVSGCISQAVGSWVPERASTGAGGDVKIPSSTGGLSLPGTSMFCPRPGCRPLGWTIQMKAGQGDD